jgi:hypothetical protein
MFAHDMLAEWNFIELLKLFPFFPYSKISEDVEGDIFLNPCHPDGDKPELEGPLPDFWRKKIVMRPWQ